MVHLDKAEPRKLKRLRYEFYTVFFKQIYCGDLRYGLNHYDYEEGTSLGKNIGDYHFFSYAVNEALHLSE